MNLPTVEEVSETLLAWFWIVATRWRDRSPQAMIEHVNELTGLPDRAEDLVPKHRALVGSSLATTITPTPGGLAMSWLRYHADATVKCTSLAECDGCRELGLKPKHTWDDEETAHVAEITYLIKRAVHEGAAWGLFDPAPPDVDGRPMVMGEDGMTMRFAITPLGLEQARQMCPGSKWDTEAMRRGWEHAVTKAEYSKAPAWLRGGG